jgi:DNA-binding ferritin-like protein
MKEIAILLKVLQEYGHLAHNLAARSSFFADHEFLGEAYLKYEEDYDSVVERVIGLYGEDSIDLVMIQDLAVQKLKTIPGKADDNNIFFLHILALEKELCDGIKKLMPQISEGSKQLFGEIANQSEIRQYKLKRRIHK